MSQATAPKKVFLSAKWENLVMLNYEVDPAILQKHLPIYTEVDFFEEKALVSVVGFLFNNTKVFGVRWPFHTNFDEVNLRYYLRCFDGSKWKRGVGFVSEIVSKPIIATIANTLYNEHYSVAEMKHKIVATADTITATYQWKKRGQQWNSLSVNAVNSLQPIDTGSAEEFIFEHYFGYNQLNKNTTIEYAVEHPRWQVYPVTDFTLQCDVAKLYGEEFVPFIENVKPHSVFFAKGSEVIVRKPVYIKG
jgi:uncharacterized protein YqjF (DUF2071 family)